MKLGEKKATLPPKLSRLSEFDCNTTDPQRPFRPSAFTDVKGDASGFSLFELSLSLVVGRNVGRAKE